MATRPRKTSSVKSKTRTTSSTEQQALEHASLEKFEKMNNLDYVQDCMVQYGTQTLENRAVPDFRDGLIPVQRRILYGMFAHNLGMGDSLVKAAKVIGTVLGNYHPHGDVSCYNAMVTLAQSPVKLITPSGNWGTYDDPGSAAAYRYCVVGDTKIRTNKGLVRADSLGDKKGRKLSGYKQELHGIYTSSLEGATEEVSHWLNSGKHKVMTIEVEDGSNITCTPNHPLLVFTKNHQYEWKEAGSLQLGEYICKNRNTDILKNTGSNDLSINMAALLGYWVSDGYINNVSIQFTSAYKSTNADYRNLVAACVPGLKLHETLRNPSSYGKRKYKLFELNSKSYIKYLGETYGLFPGTSYTREVPSAIWSAPTAVVASFLSAYFEGDGSITFTNSGVNIAAHSVSEKLLQEIKLLLWEHFGIQTSRVLKEKSDPAENGLKIYLQGIRSVEKFIHCIGFRSGRKERVAKRALAFIDAMSNTAGNSKTDILPYSDKLRVHKTIAGFRRWFGKQYLNGNKCDNRKISGIYRANYFHAKVTAIVHHKKPKWVYDVTVPKSHAFTANGFVVHNTECKVSPIAKDIFFSGYLPKVHDLIANFDGSDVEPAVLHCNLPVVLLLGKTGIAMGLAVNIPSFTLESIAKLTRIGLSGKKITPKMCKETLEFVSSWGKDALHPKHLSDGSYKSVIESGTGHLSFLPEYTYDESEGVVHIKGIPLNLKYETAVAATQQKGYPFSDGTSVDSEGLDIRISLKKTRTSKPTKADLDAVIKIWTGRTFPTRIAVTERKMTEVAKAEGASTLDISVIPAIGIADLLNRWVDYRLDLEVELAQVERDELKSSVGKLTLIMLARKNIDTIHKAWKVDNPIEYVAEALDISIEDSKYIFSLTIMRLTKIDIDDTKDKISNLKEKIKACNVRIKNPSLGAVACIDNIIANHIKTTKS